MKTEKKKIPKWTIVIIILIIICVIGGLVESEKKLNRNSSSNKTNTNEISETKIEPNTNDMIDNLITDAREKVKNGVSTEELDIALNYIKSHVDNPFESNKVMENLIYYGSLLEYYYSIDNDPFKGFSSVEGEIGMDAVQSVKYVYRNVESPEDSATMQNINQLKENLEKLN